MKKILFFLLLLSIALLQGCTPHMANPKDANASLVYGFIDMDKALQVPAPRSVFPGVFGQRLYWPCEAFRDLTQ